jgi:hypothetical protein
VIGRVVLDSCLSAYARTLRQIGLTGLEQVISFASEPARLHAQPLGGLGAGVSEWLWNSHLVRGGRLVLQQR